MNLASPEIVNISLLWVSCNFVIFLSVFLTAIYINVNFNTVMVGLIYLIPLIPMGLGPENEMRFLMVSFQNLVFGVIEVVIFVMTVQPADAVFDKDHIRQLAGHVLPIALALMGLSFVSRMTAAPMAPWEMAAIVSVFAIGAILRVVAVYQIGRLGFKFDIVFREEQRLKTDQLYGLVRHPSYTAMMLVILAYAMNTHNWVAGTLGMLSAWAGFQFRIHYEEKALEEHFGGEYIAYKEKTGMWLPLPGLRRR